MTEEEARKKINTVPDFVNSKRYDHSLQKLEERYPDGAPNKVIANVLMIEEEEVEPEFDRVVVKLREKMGVDES